MPLKKITFGKKVSGVGGMDTSELTLQKLEQFSLRMKEELDKDKDEHSFQSEKDKIRTFWELTRQQLDDAKVELKKFKERTIQEAKDQELEQEENEEKQKIRKKKLEQQAALAASKVASLRMKLSKDEYEIYK